MDQGSVTDPLFGPGSWTTIMDRVHGHFVNFYRKVLHRVHEYSFLNSGGEQKQRKKQDMTRRCRPMLTIDYKYFVVLT